jgi:hypothetical protein
MPDGAGISSGAGAIGHLCLRLFHLSPILFKVTFANPERLASRTFFRLDFNVGLDADVIPRARNKPGT